MSVIRHRLLLLATAIGVVIVALPLSGSTAQGELPYYAAVGNAESARITLTIPGAPLAETLVDGGGTRSQASSGGIDGSRGYAAAPDPGEAIVTLPPLLKSLTGVDLPEYPLAVGSQDPLQPDDVADVPGIHLHAASSQQRSEAETVIGSADGQVRTTATAGAVDEEVSAHAEAVIGEINAGPLRISGLRSAASLTRHADGKIERHSELTVASASILGVPISIGADGITVANTLIPIPGAGSLRDLLLSAGLRVQVLAGESTDTSVTSPALVITTSFVSFLEKPGTATVMVGRASALLDLVTPPAATTTSVAAPGAGPGPSLSPSFDTACCPSAAASNLGSTGSPLAPARTVAASVSGPPIQWQLRNIYLAFVIAALALTAGNAALRHLGVRT